MRELQLHPRVFKQRDEYPRPPLETLDVINLLLPLFDMLDSAFVLILAKALLAVFFVPKRLRVRLHCARGLPHFVGDLGIICPAVSSAALEEGGVVMPAPVYESLSKETGLLGFLFLGKKWRKFKLLLITRSILLLGSVLLIIGVCLATRIIWPVVATQLGIIAVLLGLIGLWNLVPTRSQLNFLRQGPKRLLRHVLQGVESLAVKHLAVLHFR
mmetsp:Transcript_9472/g.21493  ORF Transcript_9472/g.21493 Transcript_9472/m.21493 type:complete len:214 (+) Transcript_9472:682-1323(+)